ncbi:hypothetical protein GCM10008090_11770 [Arenicella chitinivorans]|uniref:Microcin J25-processing protein McjB C-terminal domain-containing protein n=1 Tax=Arenicella chitinivorans TaxID=1329800 RepID=A0A918RKY1_9GAMM|nr:hypothetical protein GCM10008090_11770 [Arenicella chitinivorans]
MNTKLDLTDTVDAEVGSDAIKTASQVHESVRLAARLHWLPLACLPKSIVLLDMLQTMGIPACLKLGVNKREQQFASHAWVQVGSAMIGEPEHVKDRFIEIHHR